MLMAVKIRKKGHPNFNVPNYGAKSRKHVLARWRKQRGIDNKKRVKKAHMGAEPTIGYRNPEAVRHVRRSGKTSAMIRNVRDLELFHESKMHETHDAIIAHSVSKRTRRMIVEAAKKRGIEVANPGADLERKPKAGKEAKAAKAEAKAEAAQKGQGPAKGREGPKPPQAAGAAKENGGAVNEH